jgi:SRSO17 transposase
VDDHDAREILERFGTFVDQFGVCFSRRPQREAARRYLDGLLNYSERKSMQAMHGRLSDPATYQALQHFVTHAPWEAETLWTRLRAVLPARAGLVVVDDTGLPKQGRHSPGVQRQYCGALGKIGNC